MGVTALIRDSLTQVCTRTHTFSDAAKWISALQAQVDRLEGRRPFEEPLQLCPTGIDADAAATTAICGSPPLLQGSSISRQKGSWPLRLWPGAPWPGGGWETVKSLDQVYCQAACLSPILRERVRIWAKVSGGKMVLARNNRAHVYFRPQGVGEVVKLGDIKAVGRAVEKLFRSYGQVSCVCFAVQHPSKQCEDVCYSCILLLYLYLQDVSKLVDVCRQSIIIEHPADLAGCLKTIADDPEVEVHQS